MPVTRYTVDGGSITIEVDDTEVRRALNASLEGVQSAMREAMYDAGSVLVRGMRERLDAHGKRDTGGTIDSIMAEIVGRRGQIELIVGPDEEHAAVAATLEEGRAPGSKYPPPGVLPPWMARHGIIETRYPVGSGYGAVEFLIARKIGQMGMNNQPFPFAGPALSDNRQELDQIFDSVLDAIESDWAGA